MSGLIGALDEIRAELGNGAKLTDALINEISAEFGINPILLKRKIAENGITTEKVQALIKATDPSACMAAAVAECIAATISVNFVPRTQIS